jgi:hypothetical protein
MGLLLTLTAHRSLGSADQAKNGCSEVAVSG